MVEKAKNPHFIKYALGALLFLVFILIVRDLPLREWSLNLSRIVQHHGALGMLAFATFYILCTLLLLPCAFLTFAAGVTYGIWGFPLVMVSALIGACCAFFIARFMAQERVDRYVAKRPVTKALKTAIAIEGWKFTLLLRISPLVPFTWNNYFLGVAPVSFKTYLWTTLVSMIPGTALYIYLGSIGGAQSGEDQLFKWTLFIIGLVATLVLARMTTKKTQEILQRQSSSAHEGYAVAANKPA